MNIKVIKKIEILNSDLKSYFENTSLIFFLFVLQFIVLIDDFLVCWYLIFCIKCSCFYQED